MPTYDYKCRDCTFTATITTGIKETLNVPICGNCKLELVRDYGLQGIAFKGSGFYSTDKGKP
jgi:putative FmdB family regulatory protein